ncbi:IPT/TIG domain-containing protein [Marinigracilibium pacificum]|uniref:IPT/TIG domain-containing protein n=1 Tax=Marinigracilibium pacificum TaxID=2729599 RepID=A0A848IXY0_9BACT|nr:IPT/TIG domain-containing protein [Marinigracilibium pacificum]NMM46829.1 hypothetical protein [Marinigracilibium pacificum]
MQKYIFLLAIVLGFMACKDQETPNPIITDIESDYANRGEMITITGSNFTNETEIEINGIPVEIVGVTSEGIQIKVPENATAGDLIVKQGNTEINTGYFHIYTPATALYYTFWNDNEVSFINLLANNSISVLYDNQNINDYPNGLTHDKNGYLYFAEEVSNRIIKAKEDGSSFEVLYDSEDGVSTPSSITIDYSTNKLYWTNKGNGAIMVGNTMGTEVPYPLFGEQEVLWYSYGIQVDSINSKIYFSDFIGSIKVGELDGTGTPTVIYDTNNTDKIYWPSDIYTDFLRGKIYWTDESLSVIMEANIDGSGDIKELFNTSDGLNRTDGVYVDYAMGKIYWSETNNQQICRGNLDGSGEKEVLANGPRSYGMYLKFE